jgi:hypothetical protein
MFEYNAERSGEKRVELLASLATLRKPEGRPQNTHIMPPFTFEYVSVFLTSSKFEQIPDIRVTT